MLFLSLLFVEGRPFDDGLHSSPAAIAPNAIAPAIPRWHGSVIIISARHE
jgi:hypothetical protein